MSTMGSTPEGSTTRTLRNSPPDSSNPDLPPDMFLYGRKGPWPQPSPAHPLKAAAEVLSVPLVESLVWDVTVGRRLLTDSAGFTGFAAQLTRQDLALPIPSDADFDKYMWNTVYSRFMQNALPDNPPPPAYIADVIADLKKKIPGAVKWWKYDFSAMTLVKPLDGFYCAPVVCIFAENAKKNRSCVAIIFRGDKPGQDAQSNPNLTVYPEDPAWDLAKIYALQGAAYHMLFVVHPALHFPMDAVNAITKTAMPQNHPLFQLLYPHTSYTLALDNTVLEGANSVLNDNPQGTWFDPFTSGGYNIKLLSAAGYTGLQGTWWGDTYPPYDFMKPQMGFDSDYGNWLAAYFVPFKAFCDKVADAIVAADNQDTYVKRWARYNATYVQGFPDEKTIAPNNGVIDKDCLAQAMAIYLWDVTVSHGGDHYSFSVNVPAAYKFLRIRKPPPRAQSDESPKTVGDAANGDDLYRAEMAHTLFFMPHAMKPNLSETLHPFTDPNLSEFDVYGFHLSLQACSAEFTYSKDSPCMPLTEDQVPNGIGPSFTVGTWPLSKTITYPFDPYSCTIPASIQY
jgi:hypothetical protein